MFDVPNECALLVLSSRDAILKSRQACFMAGLAGCISMCGQSTPFHWSLTESCNELLLFGGLQKKKGEWHRPVYLSKSQVQC